jgi:AcrR family transcriptional regulator
VSTTSFYARYRSKEEVLDALVRRLLEALYAVARETVGRSTSVEQGFELGVEMMCEVLKRHRVTVRLTLTEAASIEAVRQTLRASYSMLAGLLTSELAELVRRRAVSVDPEGLAWAIVGALHLAVMRWAVFGDLDDEALLPALRHVARTLLPRTERQRSGPRPPGPPRRKTARRSSRAV